MKKRYTFDTLHKDSFPRKFLIRFAREDEMNDDDSFSTLVECQQVLNKNTHCDIFISSEVLKYQSDYNREIINSTTLLLDDITNKDKCVNYDDTRDASVRIVQKLITLGHLEDNVSAYFEIQDTIQNEMNSLLGLDIDSKYEVKIID